MPICIDSGRLCGTIKVKKKRFSLEEGKEAQGEESDEKTEAGSGSISGETDTEEPAEEPATEPETVCVDWSGYFNGLNGTAVVYDAFRGAVYGL